MIIVQGERIEKFKFWRGLIRNHANKMYKENKEKSSNLRIKILQKISFLINLEKVEIPKSKKLQNVCNIYALLHLRNF